MKLDEVQLKVGSTKDRKVIDVRSSLGVFLGLRAQRICHSVWTYHRGTVILPENPLGWRWF